MLVPPQSLVIGLCRLPHAGCLSLLHSLSWGSSSQCCLNCSWLQRKHSVVLVASAQTSCAAFFTMGSCYFSSFYLGKEGKAPFALRFPKTLLWFLSSFFPLTVPQGGAGTGLRDTPLFREHSCTPYKNCICFLTDFFFIHVPRSLLFFKHWLLRYNLHTLKCTDLEYAIQ